MVYRLYHVAMTDSPRIHLGTLLRTDEDAHASGELDYLIYQQGQQEQKLIFTEPAPFDMNVNSLGGHEMYLQGSFEPTIVMECARCLRDVPVLVNVELGTLMRYEPSAEAPYLEDAETGEEILIFGDLNLDLSSYLAETTLLSAPLSVLHDEECKGLCQICGHDLNDGSCEHMAQVPVEEIDDDLGIPEGASHAKQTPFAVLRDLQFPEK